MSDPLDLTDNINDNSDIKDVICEKSILAKRVCINNDMTEWSIVHFDSDEEENVEGFSDLIPSSWITMNGTLSWYPMNEHKATIHRLVKQCANASLDWNCFSIKKLQEGIENYERGMKMLVKIARNPNATLCSNVEEKGKGKRLKKPIKYFDDSDKENNVEKRRNAQSTLPPVPKLVNVIKPARTNWPLPDKVDKKKLNVSREIPKNRNDTQDDTQQQECGRVKPPKDSRFTEIQSWQSESATIALEGMPSSQKIFLSALKKCKVEKNHKCAYTSEGEVTLESVADAICHLNAEIFSCKLTLCKTDKNVESFLESEMMAKKPTIENSTVAHVLKEFPITNLDDLRTIERKLKKDETFHSSVVDALHLEIKGESIQKTINSVLRIVLDDKLASLFNWKGQRGTKLKLSKRRISKIMIEAVTKEFPTINEMIFGRKAGPWLAQATFRIKKYISKDEACPDNKNHSLENSESNDDDKNDEVEENDKDKK